MGRYKGRTFIRERVHVCGNYLDTEIYPVFQVPGKRRKKCRPTREVQEKINQRNAERRLTRLVHVNFSEEDLALGLSYDNAHLPQDTGEAKKRLQRFLRLLRGEYKKMGLVAQVHHHDGDIEGRALPPPCDSVRGH